MLGKTSNKFKGFKSGNTQGSAPSKEDGGIDEVKSWYQDRYETVTVQRNVLFLVTVIALIGLAGAVMAVAGISDSKIFEPFVVQIEDKTGALTRVDTRAAERYKSEPAVIKYFLAKYVEARESYNIDSYQHFYYTVVRMLSNGEVYGGFRQTLTEGNADNPLKLARNSFRDVEIKSISFLEKRNRNTNSKVQESDIAQVRMVIRQKQAQSNQVEKEWNYIATIGYGFFPLDLSEQQLYINPLGFQITSYSLAREQVQ